jgi:hypothetical protein
MSTDREAAICRDLAAAQHASLLANAAMLEFQAACLKGDWAAAEEARLRVLAGWETTLDNFMAAYRRVNG